jgi:hypothetical protein
MLYVNGEPAMVTSKCEVVPSTPPSQHSDVCACVDGAASRFDLHEQPVITMMGMVAAMSLSSSAMSSSISGRRCFSLSNVSGETRYFAWPATAKMIGARVSTRCEVQPGLPYIRYGAKVKVLPDEDQKRHILKKVLPRASHDATEVAYVDLNAVQQVSRARTRPGRDAYSDLRRQARSVGMNVFNGNLALSRGSGASSAAEVA